MFIYLTVLEGARLNNMALAGARASLILLPNGMMAGARERRRDYKERQEAASLLHNRPFEGSNQGCTRTTGLSSKSSGPHDLPLGFIFNGPTIS